MSFWTRVCGWWDGATINTRYFTRRKGVRVGEDQGGNVYFQTRDGKRRWVIYNGEAEASRVPVEWHGWLHHTFDLPPTDDPVKRKAWEKPSRPNLTGEPGAYYPPGSLLKAKPLARSDYEAWSPDQG